MSTHVCPWWLGYLLASSLRRWIQDPGAVVGPFVSEGMTVLQPGPGRGFFTLELARETGLSMESRPGIRRCHAAVLIRDC